MKIEFLPKNTGDLLQPGLPKVLEVAFNPSMSFMKVRKKLRFFGDFFPPDCCCASFDCVGDFLTEKREGHLAGSWGDLTHGEVWAVNCCHEFVSIEFRVERMIKDSYIHS